MFPRRLRLALLPALFCSACNVAPKYVRPVALPPAVFPAEFKELRGNDQWKFATPGDDFKASAHRFRP